METDNGSETLSALPIVPSTQMPSPASTSQKIQSAVFALIFSPLAFILNGYAVTDIQSFTAQGQPLSSAGGVVSLLVSTVIFIFITINSEETALGLIVTTIVATIIGTMQLGGWIQYPSWLGFDASSLDTQSAVMWGLYPISVIGICLSVTLSTMRVSHITKHMPMFHISQHLHPHFREQSIQWIKWGSIHLRSIVLVDMIVLLIITIFAFIQAAPHDITPMATSGLEGLDHNPHQIAWSLLAALCLSLIVWQATFLPIAPLILSTIFLVAPSAFIIPLVTSLTGQVPTPGPSWLTSMAMAAPVLSTLGLQMATMSTSPFLMRKRIANRRFQNEQTENAAGKVNLDKSNDS